MIILILLGVFLVIMGVVCKKIGLKNLSRLSDAAVNSAVNTDSLGKAALDMGMTGGRFWIKIISNICITIGVLFVVCPVFLLILVAK